MAEREGERGGAGPLDGESTAGGRRSAAITALRPGESLPEFLLRLAHDAASGELVVAGENTQIHVYLQRGRLAWAMTSTAPLAFTRHLVKRAGIDRRQILEAVERARRQGARLGEFLASEGIAPFAAVREALQEQIVGALSTLPRDEELRAVFLPTQQGSAEYDVALTFDLMEVAAFVLEPERDPSPALLDDLSRELPEARWIQLLRHGRPRGQRTLDPGVGAPVSLPALAATVFANEERLCVIRTPLSYIYGLRLEGPGASIWCAVPGEVKLGLVHQVLAAHRPPAGAGSGAESVDEAGIVAQSSSGLPDSVVSLLAQVGDETPEFQGAALVTEDTERSAVVARGGSAACQRAVEAATALRDLLSGSELTDLAEQLDGRERYSTTAPRLEILVERPSVREFAGRLGPLDSPTTLWLRLPTSSPQGLGWALLAALSRRLMPIVPAL